MASKVWHTELWKSWDKHGKNDFLKLIKHKFKEGNTPEWRRGLYELISNGIHGNVKKDIVVQTLGELTSFDGSIPSAIVDIFTLIDAEAHNEERSNFYYIVKESEKFLTDRILKERLEIETLQDVGTLKNKNFQTKFIKVKTKLYYKQRKFNLFREESEGYSKLIVELNQERPDSEVASTLEIVKSLIGYFNLDPNRVLDILLETFENRPQDDALFIPLIRSYMSDQQVLCEVLGFKYCSTINATPFSLQKVTALMLQHGVIKLDDILPWLVPDDKIIISDHEQVMKQAKEYVRKLSVISTKDKEDIVEEKENAQDKYASNQKFGLCEALLEVGAWEVAQSLFNRLPDYCFTDQRPIALALCKMIQALVESVYRKAAEEMTSDQLDAMAGGDLLKNEAGYFSQVRNTKKSSQRLKETLAEQDLAVTLCLLMAQQKHCVVYRETDKSHLKLVGKLYDQCQDTLVQFGTFLGSTMTVDEYVERLPSIHSMLQDNHIHADVAFFLARPMFAHAINIKYDALRKADPNYKKMSTAMKQLKYAEAAQTVMAPVAQSVRPLHPLKVWEDISPQFLVTFWSLSMYDLYVPVESYQREVGKLKQLAVQTVDSKDMNISKGKKEQERYTTLIEKLQDEKRKQEEHVEKVFAYLRQEKDTWFLSRSAKSAKNETITQFLQLCLFPRCTFTTVDAMYCAKFVHPIHSLKTANFSTLLCYDRLFCDITYSVTSCTENEANRYGRFLCAMLETVMRWHSEKAIFDKECSNYPGFVTKFRVSNQFSEANDMVGFENYRHVCHKWHYKITKAIVVCLDSKDYVQIRNSLIILIKILPHFPVLAKLSQILERKVEKVREEERGQRQDLHVLGAAAKTQDTTNNETSEKVSNGVTVKENNNGDTRSEKENKEQREKRSSSSQTHHENSEKFRKKEDSKDVSEVKEKYVKKEEIKDDEGLDKKDRKYYKEEHYYSSSVDNLDRDLSSVSNSSASSGPIQEGPERVSDVKRRKIESTQKVPIFLDKKERSSKGKARDEQKELRREKKQGRKRDRAEESIATTEQKRRKDDERAKSTHQNGDIPEHREKHHYSKEKSPYSKDRPHEREGRESRDKHRRSSDPKRR
ncbi:PREDICTED: THO complex subunit 2 [Acromyrmex echinatior]|uniref:THO complex subunit 2 n=1 Tax=Acromyrmex echinatior TaxID=103372 RepID=UPI000581091D|nr:PREDICTED: THO complex subunit 2 [Acromyrmex echinatior]